MPQRVSLGSHYAGPQRVVADCSNHETGILFDVPPKGRRDCVLVTNVQHLDRFKAKPLMETGSIGVIEERLRQLRQIPGATSGGVVLNPLELVLDSFDKLLGVFGLEVFPLLQVLELQL